MTEEEKIAAKEAVYYKKYNLDKCIVGGMMIFMLGCWKVNLAEWRNG